ncbi:outer membrane beta-barrel protein [Myxococcus sp. K15C18031901]|uniref:outer membrane beta-barrel protein n=1 Tax=Myxococcus dinghuensis TaxID=2906761 RepID=UPI0020A742A5|nr:outer membrane beta-barrel protein [Myxococcus dinghuensis]MCP3100417.1 outer membrane beta-barrel protein [Myxococcus dinghuensis]
MLRRLLPPLALLVAAPAFAQDEEDAVPESLNGVGRITIQGGWRVTSNETFYKRWYGRSGNEGLSLARKTEGGPLAVASFAYAFTDMLEVGIDLFATGSSLYVTQPGATPAEAPFERRIKTLGYGALLGLRFQTVLPEVGPYGLVPFAGIFLGPALVTSERAGEGAQEDTSRAYAASLGATWRLSANWGLTAEYRFVYLRGPVGPPEARVGSFNLGGNWMALGVTYTFPPDLSRPLSSGGLGF